MLTITTSFWCFLFSFVSVTLPLTLQFFVKHILYLGLLCKTLYHIFHYILNGSHFFGRFSIFCCIVCFIYNLQYLCFSCSHKCFFFLTYSQPGPSFIILFVQYSQSDLPPLRPLCGEAPGRDSNPGRADLVAGTLTPKPYLKLYKKSH